MKLPLCVAGAALLGFLSFTPEATADTIYVDAVNGSDENDGWMPETALKTLQMAVDLAFDGDEIVAAPGVYDEGGRPETDVDPWSNDALTNRVHIPFAVTLRSSAGPDQTFIMGQRGSGGDGLGPDAVRCVLATVAGTVIEGFTITNGHTMANNWSDDSAGGGVRCGWDGVTLSNCVVVGNAANMGGGLYYGNGLSCRLLANTAVDSGGGAQYGDYENCLFVGNAAGFNGGAVADGYLVHC